MDDKTKITNHHEDSTMQWSLPEEMVELARGAGASVIVEVLTVFEEDSQSRLDALREAVERDESDGIRSHAHSLKGSAAQVGAMAMSESCREMEQLAQDASKRARLAQLEEIESRFARVRERLSAFDCAGILSHQETRS
jgi:HPt (histidine-containing phosphotransfer) domain-containing protein